MNTSKYYKFVMTAMFAAVILILAFTPLGFIQMGIIKATIIHIPVILGSVLLGPKAGAILGSLFGLTSLISNTMMPALLSFVFSPLIEVPGTGHGSISALLVCFIPRILVGIVPYFIYRLFKRLLHNNKLFDWAALAAAGIAGSMTNTLLVLNFIYIFFQKAYAQARNIPAKAVYGAIMTIISVNGIPEALVAGVIVSAVGKVLIKLQKSKNNV